MKNKYKNLPEYVVSSLENEIAVHEKISRISSVIRFKATAKELKPEAMQNHCNLISKWLYENTENTIVEYLRMFDKAALIRLRDKINQALID